MSGLLVFTLFNKKACIDMCSVREILLPKTITKMPCMPEYMIGLINIHGHVIPVMDLRIRLSLKATFTDKTCIIVIDTVSGMLAVVADEVNGIIRNVETINDTRTEYDFIKGLCSYNGEIAYILGFE